MRILTTALLLLLTLGMLAQAEPRQMRRIIGKREIDIYRNGLMFEKDNVVGVTKR